LPYFCSRKSIQNVLGVLIAQGIAPETLTGLPSRGIYIVTNSKEVLKIIY